MMKSTIRYSLVILFAFIAFAFTSLANAQQPHKDGKSHKKFDARLKECSTRLNLSKEQETKFKEIMIASRKDAKKIMDDQKSTEERKPEMKALSRKTDDQILSILDDKQKLTYQEMKKERREKQKIQSDKQKEMRMEMDDAGIL